jgi:hypothetical protein
MLYPVISRFYGSVNWENGHQAEDKTGPPHFQTNLCINATWD